MSTSNSQPLSWALTVKEACAALNIARSKLYYLINPKSRYYDPTFPKLIRIGQGSVRLDRNAVVAWYAQQQDGASAFNAQASPCATELPP